MKKHRQEKTLRMMDDRLKKLKDNFDAFVEHFDNTPNFSGPSLYFHQKTINILRNNSLLAAFENELFFEYLYATLASWGLHKMGKMNAKLVDFDNFKGSITSQRERFLLLGDKRITELSIDTPIVNQLQKLMENLKISKGKTKLVYNSKTIHHLLPDLMPPIDRQYTLYSSIILQVPHI